MIEITGKVVGMGYMPKTTIAQMQRGGAATYIEIKPEGSKSVVRVRSQHGTDQYNNAGRAMIGDQDFHYKGDLV